MKSRKPILYLAIVFAIICLYQLSFTWYVNSIEESAIPSASKVQSVIKEKINNDRDLEDLIRNREEELFLLDSNVSEFDSLKSKIYHKYESDSLYIAGKYNKDSIFENLKELAIRKNSKDNFLGWYTFEDCKERELNLGLDLKGGMNVMLEIDVKDYLISLSSYSNNDEFLYALKLADLSSRNTDFPYFDLFCNAVDSVSGDLIFSGDGDDFSKLFKNQDIRDDIQGKNNEAAREIIEEKILSSTETFFQVLSARIDKFGVVSPNLQKIEPFPSSGRIMVELPGIKNPDRAKRLLQTSANLQFWTTYDFGEIADGIQEGNDYLARISGFEKDTTISDSDTSSNSDTLSNDEALEKFNQENPFFALVTPSVDESGRTTPGPVVGYFTKKDKQNVRSLINDQAFMSKVGRNVKFAIAKNPNLQKDNPYDFILLALKKDGMDGYQMDGTVIDDASTEFRDRKWIINMSMLAKDQNGAKKWREITGNKDNQGKSIAIVLDGEAKSWPTVNDEIPDGRSEISGNFTKEEADDLVNVLKSGSVPVKAKIIKEAIIGPTLGEEAIKSGKSSFIYALIIVLLYMIFYYYGAGIVSNVALVANVFFIFGVLASLGSALTLPGIAGIVLTIGMSVDANVLIYERIREELKNNKGISLAIADGYKSAYSSIIDANVTTLLTGIILYYFGTGPIQGFATTLIIGIITSLFSAIFITRLIISARLNRGKSMSFSTKLTDGAFKNLNINFIGKRKIFYVISSILILFGGYSLYDKGLDQGIDFVGGRTYVVSFSGDIDRSEIKKELASVFNNNEPAITKYGQSGDLKITTKYKIADDGADALVKEKLFTGLDNYVALQEKSAGISYEKDLQFEEKVGSTIADDIKTSAWKSIIFSLIVIFLYILVRFRKWQFSLGAVVAVFHDVLLVLSVFSIFQGIMPFSLEIDQAFIAAILTIIGYSLNDTVVVFDRVREYMLNYKKKQVHEIINTALNSTLSRTINTSLTTLVVLTTIFILGSESIKGFMFALMVGVLVGTYSSLFVASPIMMDTIKRKDQ